jgi:hypothetical protein
MRYASLGIVVFNSAVQSLLADLCPYVHKLGIDFRSAAPPDLDFNSEP